VQSRWLSPRLLQLRRVARLEARCELARCCGAHAANAHVQAAFPWLAWQWDVGPWGYAYGAVMVSRAWLTAADIRGLIWWLRCLPLKAYLASGCQLLFPVQGLMIEQYYIQCAHFSLSLRGARRSQIE